MEKTFNLLFYLKKPKNYVDGPIPIYLRITVDGSRKEVSCNRECLPDRWNATAGRAFGVKEDVRSINADLDILQNKIYEYRRRLLERNEDISADILQRSLKDDGRDQKTILSVFQHHNDQVKALVGKDYAPGTLDRYETSYDHTKRFIKWQYKMKDVSIQKLDYEFIAQYEFWLKSVRNCNHNTTMKYLSNFKKIVNECIKRRWLERDPFLGFKMTKNEVLPKFLTEIELNAIANKKFSVERLAQVRDVFLFCCYTGLAYADVKKLTKAEIHPAADGGKWIYTKRQKTDSLSRVPLLPIALQIIDRYTDNEKCELTEKLLPVSSNQRYNGYLKEIAAICGISKNLTSHVARHTFATTVTLSNGVPIESVSKMLGHKDLKTTQHYAKVLDKKIYDDMKLLKEKLGTTLS